MDCKRKLPKLVVFDLDYTLWPFWIDTHVTPPFRILNGKVIDFHGKRVKFYPEVPQVLKKLSDLNIPIGIASRTSELEGAEQLCKLFDWDKYFIYKEIYPGSKVTHFERIKDQSRIDFHDMIFFDDEDRNIKDVGKLNVTCVHVFNGVTLKLLDTALEMFSKKK